MTEVHATSVVTKFADRIARQLPVENVDWEIYTSEVIWLLEMMQAAGQTKAVTALADRVVLCLPLDDALHLASVLRDLHRLKAASAVNALAARAAQHAPAGPGVADVIEALRDVGATAALATLAKRAVRQAPDVYTPGEYLLLAALHDAGAVDELTVLANHVALGDPASIAWLLEDLEGVGEDDAVQVLLSRDPASQVCLTGGTSFLLSALRDAGADDATRLLLSRNPASQIHLDDPAAIAWLLEDLAEVGADDELQALLARDPASNVPVHAPRDVSYLLDVMHKVGDHHATATLADRAACGVHLAAAHHGGHLFGVQDVACLLESMSKVGVIDAMATLAGRAARELPLDDEGNVIDLLQAFHEIGASEATAILLARDPANRVILTGLPLMRNDTLADVLQEVGASDAAGRLARRQADSGLHKGAFAKLVKRLPEGGSAEQIRQFGREPDSSPSPAWTWNSL